MLRFLPRKTEERVAAGRACPEPVEGAAAWRHARVSVYLHLRVPVTPW